MEWKCLEDESRRVDIWITTPQEGTLDHGRMMQALGDYVDNNTIRVNAQRTFVRYPGGTKLGLQISLHNFPQRSMEAEELLRHAEMIGRKIAEVGKQGTFVIEEAGGAVYWFTSREEHHREDLPWV